MLNTHEQQQQQQHKQVEKPAALAPDVEIERVFTRFDADGDGRISPSELAAVSRAIAPPPSESAGGREVAAMMDELDTDRDGYVDLGEFASFHGRGCGDAEHEAELRAAFDVYDVDGDGRITAAELGKVMDIFYTIRSMILKKWST
ncbi:hypothetical protein E2562_022043 [Oryza meyeriana var. granulata]|uniref:EF-hand domain-containing protein n=1 Tax=Oryza meyeriana var. granulata TaxID=110450 RepID=A0A6G1ENK8_9ORYZ|nr:hypothetical protein E2562_022043 [Oryza meyeriana var. granulata]